MARLSYPLETGLKPKGNSTALLQIFWMQLRMCMAPLSLPSGPKPQAGCSEQPPWPSPGSAGQIWASFSLPGSLGQVHRPRTLSHFEEIPGQGPRCWAQGMWGWAQPHTSATSKKTLGKKEGPASLFLSSLRGPTQEVKQFGVLIWTWTGLLWEQESSHIPMCGHT